MAALGTGGIAEGTGGITGGTGVITHGIALGIAEGIASHATEGMADINGSVALDIKEGYITGLLMAILAGMLG